MGGGYYPPASTPVNEELPPFWEDQPATWFEVIESSYNRMNITNSRHRFDRTVAALPVALSKRLEGVYAKARITSDPYACLKREIIRRHQPSTLARLQKLVRGPELGGRAPSELMQEMEAALPGDNTVQSLELVMKYLFLLRLPSDLQDQLSTRIETLSPTQMAEEADRRWESRNSMRAEKKAARPVVAAVAPADDDDSEPGETVAALPQGRKAVQKKKGGRPAAQRTEHAPYLCWKHARYGEEAYSCEDISRCKMAKLAGKQSGNGRAGGN